MPKPQTISSILSVPEPEPMLSKRDRFVRIGGARVADAIHKIELFGNCSNLSLYEFEPAEIAAAFTELRKVIDACEKRFNPESKNRFGKNFFEKKE